MRRTRPKSVGRPADELEKKKANQKSGASSVELGPRNGKVRPPSVLRVDGATEMVRRSRRRRRTVNRATLCRRLVALLFSSIVAAAVVAPVLQLALSSTRRCVRHRLLRRYHNAHPIAAGWRPAMLLLVPYVTSNPGPGWLSLPDTSVQAYADQLRQQLESPGNGTVTNVAAARFAWDYGPIPTADRSRVVVFV